MELGKFRVTCSKETTTDIVKVRKPWFGTEQSPNLVGSRRTQTVTPILTLLSPNPRPRNPFFKYPVLAYSGCLSFWLPWSCLATFSLPLWNRILWHCEGINLAWRWASVHRRPSVIISPAWAEYGSISNCSCKAVLVPNSLVGTEIAVAGTEVPLATVARRGDSIVVSCSIVPGAAMWKVAAVFFYQRSHLKFTTLQYGTKQKKENK